ncbi:MAG TPA: hypothetical protein VFW07_18310 [Parafilimonas sp.]|nr:hypothetical protein [Parafilimonas sp.]
MFCEKIVALKKHFESKQRVKEEQATFLKHYSKQQHLLINNPDPDLITKEETNYSFMWRINPKHFLF